MAGSFPTSVTAYTNPSSGNNLNNSVGGRTHSQFHGDIPDDLEQVMTKLGPGSSTATAGKALMGALAAGASEWRDLPTISPVLNADFTSWQRGTSGPTATDNAYGPDQWRLLLEAANAATISQEATDLPAGGAPAACKVVVGSANNNKFGIFQPIEGREMWRFRGQTASLQLKIKTTTAIGDIRAAVVQWTGTEDAISADPINVWGAAGTNPTYTGSWANANTPVSLAPTTSWALYKIEGISISASATNLAIFVWCDDKGTTQTTDYMLITDVQLEVGATCTAYQRVNRTLTRLLCNRYLYRPTNPDANWRVVGFGQAYNTTDAVVYVKVPVPMRVAPTLSVSAASDFRLSTAGFSAVAPTTLAVYSYQGDVEAISVTGASGLVAGDATMLVFNAAADKWLQLTSEL